MLGTSPFAKQWGAAAVNAPGAWTLIDGTAYVGVNDNGMQGGHEDFSDITYGSAFKQQFAINVAPSTGYTSDVDELAGTPQYQYAGHGTHVSGVIAARHNGIGAAGICKGCSLMIAKIGQNGFPIAGAAGLS